MRIGLVGLASLELELTQMIGRRVDLNTKGFLGKHFRDAVLAKAAVMQDAA